MVLADAFGNTIDYVQYLDDAPWPDADGNGNFLQLISTSLDNALASSWIASSDAVLAAVDFSDASKAAVYPNPVSNVLTIHGDRTISGIKIFDVLGNQVFGSDENANTVQADFSSYSKGIYFLTIFDETGSDTRKIIRQ